MNSKLFHNKGVQISTFFITFICAMIVIARLNHLFANYLFLHHNYFALWSSTIAAAFSFMIGLASFIIFMLTVWIQALNGKSTFLRVSNQIDFIWLTIFACYFFAFSISYLQLAENINALSIIFVPAMCYALFIWFISSLVYRIKTKTLAETMYVWKFFQKFKLQGAAIPIAVSTFALGWLSLQAWSYLTLAVAVILFLLLMVTFICHFLLQVDQISQQHEAIETKNIFHELIPLAKRAESYHQLIQSHEHALEEKIKSERFKAELITNVSHDIKTPLTSIINFIDLIKELSIEDEKLAEYTEVLDRKSERLKILIDDLLAASKASSGNVEMEFGRIDLKEILDQLIGEFDDKFADQKLQLVNQVSDQSLWIIADGRQLWRVLENLFENIYKYAMPATRVYIATSQIDKNITLSIKNISAEQLGIAADELVQQFIRGDRSRHSEGNGLGLYIAKSLTELMNGHFEIEINGDLFETNLSLNRAD